MDFLCELEMMAGNTSLENDAITSEDTQRWQKLFNFTTAAEATKAIEEYRQDFARSRIPDDIWEAISPEKEAEGHNKESYEYLLTRPQQVSAVRPTHANDNGTYIVKLEGPLDTTARIQEAACLDYLPTAIVGTGEDDEAYSSWVAQNHGGFQPYIVRLSKARKDLSTHTSAPILGIDSTLPQYRPEDSAFVPTPAPNEYPVWYFFYGTSMDPCILSSQVGGENPRYSDASVQGGRLRIWGGKYKALVDAPGESVRGRAYLVKNGAEEDALRFFETDQYEVVRCRILEDNGNVRDGLTFRFAGDPRHLDG